MNSNVCMSTAICDLLSVFVCRIFYSISFCSTTLSHIISLHVLRSLPFSFRNREDAENCSDKANPTEQKVETRGLHCGILETDHILADKKREQPVRERGHWRHGGLSFSAGTNSILVNGSEVQFFCSIFRMVYLGKSSTFIAQANGPNPSEKATMKTMRQTRGSHPKLTITLAQSNGRSSMKK